jgi:hypothetical protein
MSEMIKADPIRIKKVSKPIADYRKFFTSKNMLYRSVKLVEHQFRSYYFVDAPPWRVNRRKKGLANRVAPGFCSTGAVRSGTSALSNYIFQHPAVVLPLSKELSMRFFALDYLQAQFPIQIEMQKAKEQFGTSITGHGTPFSPAGNMIYFNKKLNPNMKTVVILRDPVERVISHWRWDVMKSDILRSDPLWKCMPGFEESMRIEMREIAEGGCGFQLNSGSGGTSYLRHSIYAPFLEIIFGEFGRENVYLVEANDFFTNRNEVLAGVYEFLDLPPYEPVEIKEKNASPAMDVSKELKEELRDFFKLYNEALYKLIDRKFDW